MTILKVGVIGLSRRSKIVFDYLPPQAKIIAVADCDPRALEQSCGDAVQFADYRKLLTLPEIEAVFIMTRDYQHKEIAIAAMEAGKAVYLEKPMDLTVEACDRILETAYRTGSKLFLGHNMRYMPVILKMKEVIDSGVIGEIQAVWCRHFIGYGSCYFRSWCAEQAHTNGLLLQKGAHDIDVIHWLAGSFASRVVGMGKLSVYDKCGRRCPEDAPDRNKAFREDSWPPLSHNDLAPVIDIEDHNMVMLQLANGVQASYTQCFYTPDSERNYTFIGTRGRVENIGDCGDCEVHVWTRRESRQQPDIIHKLKTPQEGHGGADPQIIKAFVDFVSAGIIPNTSPVAARNAVAAGVMGHESMRNGNIPRDVSPVATHLLEYFANGQCQRFI